MLPPLQRDARVNYNGILIKMRVLYDILPCWIFRYFVKQRCTHAMILSIAHTVEDEQAPHSGWMYRGQT